jgi:hypothetical protein
MMLKRNLIWEMSSRTPTVQSRHLAVQNLVVGNINQAEPNARMFEPPQGYRIVPMDGQ